MPYSSRPGQIATTAEQRGDGFILNGRKSFVLDGHSADRLIVVARSDGGTDCETGLTLFLVHPMTGGVTRERTIMADSRNAANIRFEDVAVGADCVLGRVNAGHELLEPVLDRGPYMVQGL